MMVCIDNKIDLAARLTCAPVEVQARLFDILTVHVGEGGHIFISSQRDTL